MDYMGLKELSPRHVRAAAEWPKTQKNGERILGPSPNWKGPPPARGSEIFIGRLPRDCYEDELLPVLISSGPLYCLRLMMDFSGHNRGFAFAIYASPTDAIKATGLLNRYPIRPNCRIGAAISVDNSRLFLTGLDVGIFPDKIAEILQMNGVLGLSSIEVHVKSDVVFALVVFESHEAASQARRILVPDSKRIFNERVTVEWADPKFISQEDLKKKKTLYIKNITLGLTASGVLQAIGKIITPIQVKRISVNEGSALIEFYNHEDANTSLKNLENAVIGGLMINVSWAKNRSTHTTSDRQRNFLRNITNTL